MPPNSGTSSLTHLPLPPMEHASLIWVDPGLTTGLCVLSCDPGWLAGRGATDWAALRNVVSFKWWAQIGRYPRVWGNGDDDDAALPKARGGLRSARELDGATHPGHIDSIINGDGLYGGEKPSPITSNELRQVLQIQAVLEDYPSAAWGTEDFVIRLNSRSREVLAPVHINSMLAYSEAVTGSRARTPFYQGASMAKTTATDARLKDARLYCPGLPHATDAARHAATFLRRARSDKALRQRAWPHIFGNG